MAKVGVILSGCGVKDGSEIYETTCTYLALANNGAEYISLAPDIEFTVTDHLKQEGTSEKRNVLTEAARLARMEIKDIATVTADDFDAVILPGGFGAATNLSDFATKQADAAVNPDVEKLVAEMLEKNKPVAAICIAPGTLAKIAQNAGKNLTLTFGPTEQYKELAQALEKMGHKHQDCTVEDCIIDKENKVVTTPAFMVGPGIADINKGIEKLVKALLDLI